MENPPTTDKPGMKKIDPEENEILLILEIFSPLEPLSCFESEFFVWYGQCERFDCWRFLPNGYDSRFHRYLCAFFETMSKRSRCSFTSFLVASSVRSKCVLTDALSNELLPLNKNIDVV